jgi:hypothetical protein
MATHTREQLTHALEVLHRIGRELNVFEHAAAAHAAGNGHVAT